MRSSWLAVLLLLMGASAHAGVVSYGSSDFCGINTSGITKGPLEFLGTTVATNQSAPAFFTQTDNYQYRATSSGAGGSFDLGYLPCQKLSSFQLNNTPETEPQGEVLTDEAYPDDQLFPSWLQHLFLEADSLIEENSDRYRCGSLADQPCGAIGIRGSLEVEEVLDLQTASPAYYSFQPASSPTGLDSLAIPFVVLEPGSGDSLSMYLGSKLFFQQPLAALEPGRLYFAAVPIDGVINNPAITLWINSFGPAGTRVVVPTAVTAVPLPPAGWLALTAVCSLVLRKHRRRFSGR